MGSMASIREDHGNPISNIICGMSQEWMTQGKFTLNIFIPQTHTYRVFRTRTRMGRRGHKRVKSTILTGKDIATNQEEEKERRASIKKMRELGFWGGLNYCQKRDSDRNNEQDAGALGKWVSFIIPNN